MGGEGRPPQTPTPLPLPKTAPKKFQQVPQNCDPSPGEPWRSPEEALGMLQGRLKKPK